MTYNHIQNHALEAFFKIPYLHKVEKKGAKEGEKKKTNKLLR